MADLSIAPGSGFEVRSRDDLDTYLGAVADAGFRSVSLGLDQFVGDPAAAARLLDVHGLRCPDVLALRVSRHEEEVRAQTEALAAAAEAVGAEFVLSLIWARLGEETIDRFGRCADRVRASGARLALEMPPIGELNSIGAASRVIDAVGTKRAALMVDTFHFCRGTSTWDELESLPLDSLGYVQFDDALAPSDDVMDDTLNRRTMPGDGDFPLERFVSTLTSRGWSGLVSVEVLSADLRQLDIATYTRRAYETTAPYWS
jgi:sugar phosphate isomerase/epimerase